MPFVEVTLTSGRTPDQLRGLLSHITDAVVQAIDAPKGSVRVVIREIPKTHWSAGGVTLAERDAAPDATRSHEGDRHG
jgi:4-oxalocrotonate tautomerase